MRKGGRLLMPEYFGPNSLQTLSELVNEDLKNSSGIGGSGQDGKDGKDGKDGADGKDGLSAYEIALKHGFEGTEKEWLESLKPAPSQIPVPSQVTFDQTYFSLSNDKVSLKTTSSIQDEHMILPITAAGVDVIVGNIDILLKTI